MSLDRLLEHLGELVACDSQNPPRAIAADSRLLTYPGEVLGRDFEIHISDHGDGHVTLLARRGRPALLFNCHLDTVPAGDGWSRAPLSLTVADGRAWGCGACDIKGAAAALLTVAEATDAPMALLFTSDEEGAGGCCVRQFLDTRAARDFRRAVVCEPTGNRAVLSHRGFLSVLGEFSGVGGHSSELRALDDSAVHACARWIAAADAYARDQAAAGRPTGFNVGTVNGGLKSNIIAERCNLHYSARLPPGADNDAFLGQLSGLADAGRRASWQVRFAGPPLPAAGRDAGAARAFAEGHGVAVTEAVDFWTEASLFSAAGLDAVVLGPGHIEQAHQADEWVALEQLEAALGIYSKLVEAEA